MVDKSDSKTCHSSYELSVLGHLSMAYNFLLFGKRLSVGTCNDDDDCIGW